MKIKSIHKLLSSILILSGLFVCEANAQQEWMYNQYMFNIYDVNSAFAGNYNDLALAARYRNQWLGIDGAPVSQSISINAPLAKKLGIGMRVINEKIGARDRLSAKASFAYKLDLGKGKLGLALNAGLINQGFRKDELNLNNEEDPYLIAWEGQADNAIIFDFAMMYVSDKTLIGLEVQNLNTPEFDYQGLGSPQLIRHYVFTASQAFEVKQKNVLKPSMLIRYDESAELSAEANLSFFYNNLFWIGAGYRLDYGLIFYTEWNIGDHFRFGYSYDYPTNILKGQQNGSHELFLGCHINMKGAKPKSIRYFN